MSEYHKSGSLQMIIRTTFAFCGVLALTTLAMKHINHFAITQTKAQATSRVLLPPAGRANLQSAAALPQWQSRSAQVVEASPVASTLRDSLSTVMATGFIVAAGILGYVWGRKPNSVGLAMMAVTGTRPTLADTKVKFLTLADSSIPNMYNIPLQELLSQHHLVRYSSKYHYDEVFALGIVTVINQLLEGMPEADSARIQDAYFGALDDSAAQFKKDAAQLEQWAASKGKDLNLSGDDEVSQKLKAVAARAASGDFQYSKFFSIGLFQLLQQSGQTDPDTFTALVGGMNLDKERVTKDLKVYKDLLKRLEMAKEMKEKFLERERKKQEERMAQKAKAAEV